MSVLAVGPFLKGLFFWTQLLGAIVLISLAFGLWLWGRHFGGLSSGVSIRKDIAGAGILGLLLAYAMQFFWAAYPRGNLDWLLRVVAAWFVYVMVSAESSPGSRRVFAAALVVIASLVGLTGYLQYLGVLTRLPGLAATLPWAEVPGVGVSGSFEYHNATAIVVLCGFLLTIGLAVDLRKRTVAALSGGLATFLLLVFFFAQSRGAFVVLPVAVLVLLAGLNTKRRWQAIMLMGTSALATIAFLKATGDAITAHHATEAAQWTVLACLVGCLGGLLIDVPLRLSPRTRLTALCTIVALGLIVAFSSGLVERLLPKQAARYGEIDAEGASSRTRIYADALKVLAGAPQGRGGWGWDRFYRAYQSVEYIAREVHNHYLQVAVEAGIQGLAALAVALITLFARAWKSRSEAGPGWALAAAGTALAAHSLIDFDLSYGYLWLLLWVLFASAAPNPAAASAVSPIDREAGRRDTVVTAAVIGIALATAIFSFRLFLGSRLADKLPDIALGIEKVPVAEQAIKYDPWNTDILLALNSTESLKRALTLDPRNPEVHWQLCLRLEREYDTQGALLEAEEALRVRPWTTAYYSKVADLRGVLMLNSIAAGNRDDALQWATKILALRDEALRRTPSAKQLKAWPNPIYFALYNLRCGQSLFLAGRESEAIKPLKDATKSGLISPEACLWLYAIYERAGDSKSAAAVSATPSVRLRALNPIYRAIKTW